MRNNFMRISFLAACASFTFANAYGMEKEPIDSPSPLKLRPKDFQVPLEKQFGNKWPESSVCSSSGIGYYGETETAYVRSCYIGFAQCGNPREYFTVNIYFNERDEDDKKITKIVHNDLGELCIYKTHRMRSNKLNTFSIERDTYCQSSTYYEIISKDKDTIGQFLSVFANLKLIPVNCTNSIFDILDMGIKLEDFNIPEDRLINRINKKIEEMQKAGCEATIQSFQEIALEELNRIADPNRRAAVAWDLIKKLKKPKYFDRHTLITLCEQINQKDMPFFTEAALLKADLRTGEDSSVLDIKTRYLPSIEELLDLNGPEVRRVRTTLANAYIGNGFHRYVLDDLSVSKETTIDLLKLAQQNDLLIKKLQAELKELKDQKK